MSDQWEKYVEPAGDAMLDCDHNGIQCYSPKSIDETARAVLAVVGPLIAEDTRARMVSAAARAVERKRCISPRSNDGDGRGCEDDHCPRHGGEEGSP